MRIYICNAMKSLSFRVQCSRHYLSSMPKSKVTSRASTRKNRSLSSARPLSSEEPDWDLDYTKELPRTTPPHYKGSRLDNLHNVETMQTMTPTPQEVTLTYAGDVQIPITSTLQLIRPEDDTPRGIWPVFRLMVSQSTRNNNENSKT